MLKRLLGLTVAVVSVAVVGAIASAAPLTLGDPAPGLTVKKFVKGTPVTKFEKGKLYVVEFWATWCGPCKTSIPHLTEMQKKFKDVTFIGVSVFEQSQDGVAPFVQQMGAKMDYRVAMDSIPAGKDGQSGLMAVNWMQAAEQDGIPTAFIVDKQSHIAWIGHPMTMEEPLSKVVAGTWDLKAEAVKMKNAQEAAHKMRDLQTKVTSAMQMKDYPKVLSILDESIGTDPALEDQIGYFKFTVLLMADKTTEAAEYGDKLVDGALKDNAQGLNQLAWGIVDPAAPKKQDALVALALKAALRADDVSKQKDPAITDTLAAAYFAGGKTTQAIETQERALKMAKGTQLENDASLAQHLATYKAARK